MGIETILEIAARICKRMICLVVGHDWIYIGVWSDKKTWQCLRCSKIEQER